MVIRNSAPTDQQRLLEVLRDNMRLRLELDQAKRMVGQVPYTTPDYSLGIRATLLPIIQAIYRNETAQGA